MFLSEHGIERGDFEEGVLTALENFEAVVAAMNETCSPQARPEHFLMALLRWRGSSPAKACAIKHLNVDSLAEQVGQLIAGKDVVVHKTLTRDAISPAVEEMFRQLSDWYASEDVPPGNQEMLLSAAVLSACGPQIVRLFDFGGLNARALGEELRERGLGRVSVVEISPFDDEGNVALEAFDATGKRTLMRVKAEGRGLGLDVIGPPLLLYALVGQEGGLTDRALRVQQAQPRAFCEDLLLRLRGLGKGRLTELELTRSAMLPTIKRVFELAARDARDHGLDRVGEAHLLRALVAEDEMITGPLLHERKVDLEKLRAFAAANHDPSVAEEKALELPPIEEIVATFRNRIVGQDHVMESLQPLLRRLRFNYSRPNKPTGVFLFLGPSGTGKTETAKVLAECIYGDPDRIIFLEMGQFGSEHDKSMFIGAPPGYVGYGEGQLTNGLRDNPESVVLFDEVEKAHKSVFDVLLRFLDEGVIRDPAGAVRDGRGCLLVLTSNIMLDDVCDLGQDSGIAASKSRRPGVPTLRELYDSDPHTRQARIRTALKKIKFFRPEFVNRVDEIVLFRPLDTADYRAILRNGLAAEADRLQREKGRELIYDDDLVEALAARCSTRADEGARAVGKVVATDVIDPLIDFFVEARNEGCRCARVSIRNERTIVESA